MPEVLTVPEVAKRLRISMPKVRDMMRRGLLRGFQDGRVIRIDPESVEALIQSRRARYANAKTTASPTRWP